MIFYLYRMIMKVSHNDFIILIHCCKVRTYEKERRRVAHSTFGARPTSRLDNEISPFVMKCHIKVAGCHCNLRDRWLCLLVEKLVSENTVLDPG